MLNIELTRFSARLAVYSLCIAFLMLSSACGANKPAEANELRDACARAAELVAAEGGDGAAVGRVAVQSLCDEHSNGDEELRLTRGWTRCVLEAADVSALAACGVRVGD